MIKRKSIKAIYQEDLYCDECEERMQSTGIVLCTYPEKYEYICPKCNNKTTSLNSYPRLLYDWSECEDV